MARLEEKFRARAQKKSADSGAGAGAAASGAATFFGSLSPQRDTLADLPLAQIETDPNQPRKDLGDLSDLKASIDAVGLVQPIIVTVVGYERYRIIAGERRFTAAREVGLTKIPAIVRTAEEHQRLELQIVENLHRKDLNPFEEGFSYQRLMDEFGLTQEQVAQRLGRSQESVNETIRLLTLPERVRDEYRTSDKASKSLLLEIARQSAEEQLALWEQAKQGELTVRKLRERRERSPQRGQRRPPMPSSPLASQPISPMTFRYPIQTSDAAITVVFDRPRATQEEIVAALEEALAGERARLDTAS